jgi:hypothetical protein
MLMGNSTPSSLANELSGESVPEVRTTGSRAASSGELAERQGWIQRAEINFDRFVQFGNRSREDFCALRRHWSLALDSLGECDSVISSRMFAVGQQELDRVKQLLTRHENTTGKSLL